VHALVILRGEGNGEHETDEAKNPSMRSSGHSGATIDKFFLSGKDGAAHIPEKMNRYPSLTASYSARNRSG
jgi:hypothetical protein